MSATNPILDRLIADMGDMFDPEHMRKWDFGTACAIDSAWYDSLKPSCPMCGAKVGHCEDCPTQEKHA